jgi:hypothetical protein
MAGAEANRDEDALGRALEAFARAAVESMVLAVDRSASLDVHPSNFAGSGENLWYLDDDVGCGNRIPGIGYAVLHRVEEYSHRPRAVERYLTALEERIAGRITREQAGRLELENAFEQTLVRSRAGRAARSRLCAALSRCSVVDLNAVR